MLHCKVWEEGNMDQGKERGSRFPDEADGFRGLVQCALKGVEGEGKGREGR